MSRLELLIVVYWSDLSSKKRSSCAALDFTFDASNDEWTSTDHKQNWALKLLLGQLSLTRCMRVRPALTTIKRTQCKGTAALNMRQKARDKLTGTILTPGRLTMFSDRNRSLVSWSICRQDNSVGR